MTTPPQFPEGMEGYWSPEHLLVATVNSCLMTTFLSIAEFSKINFSGFHSRRTGKLDKVDGKMRNNNEKGMDLCLELSKSEPYPNENLDSLRDTVVDQRLRLTILFETQMAEA